MMNLKTIQVRSAYTRSVNIERDSSSESLLNVYIPTSRALDTLRRVSQTLESDIAVPRSWALIGPYGSGKSAFALFLSHLLGGPTDPLHKIALKQLRKHNPVLAASLTKKVGAGYVCLMLTGSPESLSLRLAKAISHQAATLEEFNADDRRIWAATVEKLLADENPSHSNVVDLVHAFRTHVAERTGRNVMLVIDELGKFLEYEARNQKANDIFLLQTLAEQAATKGKNNLQLLVLLHQSFDIYAKGVKASLKNEWLKVQGRFETISFIETAEQTIRLISAALVSDLPSDFRHEVRAQSRSIAESLLGAGALPSLLTVDDATEMFCRCYPIHPVALIALPYLCQRVAQNERTLFTYLGSKEPYGFQRALKEVLAQDQVTWISPAQIYDYFVENQSVSLADPLTQRRWVEVSSAVSRLMEGTDAHADTLKSIGILNLINAQGGFKASPGVLGTLDVACARSTQNESLARLPIRQVLDDLVTQSLIVFRKFTGEYRVWEGSDFDLESALEHQIAQLTGIRLSQRLRNHRKAAPIVARRFTIETGNLREFTRRFVDVNDLGHEPAASGQEILYVLIEQSADLREAKAALVKRSEGDVQSLMALVMIGPDLVALAEEVEALRTIEAKTPQLANDPIALKEVRERLRQAEVLEDAQLSYFIEEPAHLEWYWRGKMLSVQDRRQFQNILSQLLANDIYPFVPYIRNELISRRRPSSQAMAGRRKLLMAMLENGSTENLGIEKYPPEKAMYLSVLKATGIHRIGKNGWEFGEPDYTLQAAYSLRPLWEGITAFFESTRQQPKPISELYDLLAAPPYGVKEGVLPILWLAAYLGRQDDIAIFENTAFVPSLTQEGIEKLLNNPASMQIQSTALKGMRNRLLKKYQVLLLKGNSSSNSLLAVVRPIAKLLTTLPEFSKKTREVSERAQSVRSLFLKAKSPGDLLFQALPTACGFDAEALNDEATIDEYASALNATLQELALAYPALLGKFERKLKAVFDIKSPISTERLRESLRGQVQGLENLTIDTDGLKAFLLCIQDEHGDTQNWLVRIASFLAKKPADKWGDGDLAVAEVRMIDFVRKVVELQKLRVEFHGQALGPVSDFDVVLVRTVRPQAKPNEKLIRVDRDKRKMLDRLKAKIAEALTSEPDLDLKLASLGEMFEDLLNPPQTHVLSESSEILLKNSSRSSND